MTTLMQPLRDEHKDLLPHIEALRTVADMVGDDPLDAVRKGVEEVYQFLIHDLIPHAQAEDLVLYPAVEKAMNAPQATATMSRDHIEVGLLTRELALLRLQISQGTIDQTKTRALRRVLYGLYALVKVHFAKEEEIFIPLLEAKLTPEEAHHMFNAMEGAARGAKARAGH